MQDLTPRLLLSLLSGVLLAFAFPGFSLAPLAWVAFLPLFFDLYRTQNLREAALKAGSCGAVFFLISCYWIWHVSFVGYVLLSLFFGLFFIPLGVLVWYFYRRNHSAILWGSILWVSCEFLRGHIFTGFPWNTLASSQATFPLLIQLASLTGANGVSFLVIMVNIVIFECWQGIRGKGVGQYKVLSWVALVLVVGTFLYGYLELRKADQPALGDHPPIIVAAIQPNIPQEQKFDPVHRQQILLRLRNLVKEAAKHSPQLIVFPETSVPGELKNNPRINDFILSLAKEVGIPLLVGTQDSDEQMPAKYYNAAMLVHPEEGIVQTYHKLHLVPFGEFLPGARWLPFLRWFIPIPSDFSPGTERTVFRTRGSTFRWQEDDGGLRSETKMNRFSSAICFEDIFSDLFRLFCMQRLTFMVNMTNDAWFKNSAASVQHAHLAVFRAVENRISLIRATNTGYTCFIDPYGRIQGEVSQHGNIHVPGVLVAEITQPLKPSVFSQVGDFFAHACLILAFVKCFMLVRDRKKRG